MDVIHTYVPVHTHVCVQNLNKVIPFITGPCYVVPDIYSEKEKHW